MAPALQPLLPHLHCLLGRAPVPDLADAVRPLAVECADVADFVRFSAQGYTRNLIRAGAWYHVLVLCWRNGQRSPIHDHAGSSCCVRVLRGTLTETRFEFAPNGHVKALGSDDFPPGSVLASLDADMHQVSNLQAGGADLVTLHVYSPPLLRMGTYSLTESGRG